MSRRTRALDFAVIAVGSAFLSLSFIFLAARIWFRALFAGALNADPALWAAGFGAIAVLLWICHIFISPHLLSREGQAYKDQD